MIGIPESMKRLSFLIGKWTTKGTVVNSDEPDIDFSGTDTYEWILDNQYILHTVNVIMNNEKVEVLELIGNYDPDKQVYKLRSFDNTGDFNKMKAYFDESGLLHITGDNMRAQLSVNDANSMKAIWEKQDDNNAWIPWMHLELVK